MNNVGTRLNIWNHIFKSLRSLLMVLKMKKLPIFRSILPNGACENDVVRI
ncbi:hypothetical protein DFO60_3688 [Ectopseudomonas oleovorans]|uniref:Uncharacterized protein n=1 Tax=Ectopseudomonas oleovorans TaxID=301 RepID=A0A3D9EFX1_ECTOL|nr:hypothetical protein DFO60_3688 [Pseudomonas oleovorans]